MQNSWGKWYPKRLWKWNNVWNVISEIIEKNCGKLLRLRCDVCCNESVMISEIDVANVVFDFFRSFPVKFDFGVDGAFRLILMFKGNHFLQDAHNYYWVWVKICDFNTNFFFHFRFLSSIDLRETSGEHF